MLTAVKRIYRFADFTLDTSEHRLLRGREEIYLPPKTFETLLYLVERHGHLIKKNELLDTLWADAFVTENALTRCVKEVREALQDDAHQPRYIRTFPRVGYKFIADVEEIPIHAESEGLAATKILAGEKVGEDTSRLEDLIVAGRVVLPAEPVPAPPPERHTSWALMGKTLLVPLAGAALLIVLLAYYLRPKQVPPPVQIRSIAVLPFKPLVVEASDDSLQLGMADTLITTLSNVSQITVRPTSAVRKYTGLEQDAVVAGREQRVDAVLDGSIQKLGDRIRVTVRLMRVEDGAQLWAS